MAPERDLNHLPTISLVTPSFNQAQFLEETIRSVLDQNYPRLEYVIIDGGSKDGSAELIRKYQDRVAYWVSEPDGGMYDAINKGFAHTQGEVMGWINSDDRLMPWALHTIGELFARFPRTEWVASLFPAALAEDGRPMNLRPVEGYSRQAFLRGAYLPGGNWFAEFHLQQEGTFWRRSLWDRCGGRLDSTLKHAGDFDLWARFFAAGAELHGVPLPLGGFRFHNQQKTALLMEEYFQEAKAALLRHGGRPFAPGYSTGLRLLRNLAQACHRRYRRRLMGKEKARNFYPEAGDWKLQ